MPPKAKAKKEKLQTRTPAEFFAENQNIAGFDNPGKSLFTTLRELTENSLDAAEAIGALPNIELQVTELSLAELNKLQGLSTHDRVDSTLYATKGKAKGEGKAKVKSDSPVRPLPKSAVSVESVRRCVVEELSLSLSPPLLRTLHEGWPKIVVFEKRSIWGRVRMP